MRWSVKIKCSSHKTRIFQTERVQQPIFILNLESETNLQLNKSIIMDFFTCQTWKVYMLSQLGADFPLNEEKLHAQPHVSWLLRKPATTKPHPWVQSVILIKFMCCKKQCFHQCVHCLLLCCFPLIFMELLVCAYIKKGADGERIK